jgi:AraC-like DNA-binding protein
MVNGALPFLDRQAVRLAEPEALITRIADHLPLRGLLPGCPSPEFFHRNVVLRLGDLSLSSSEHSPLLIELAPQDVVTLAFTEHGGAAVEVDGHHFDMHPREMALVLPSCTYRCTTEAIVSVLIHAPAAALTRAAFALAGADRADAVDLATFNGPLLVDGRGDHRSGHLLLSLRRALRLLDQPLLRQEGVFEALHLEDLLQRHLALLLWPCLLGENGGVAPAATGRDIRLEELLEWIDAHHAEPLTLSQLARRSGESVRNLQYRFRRRVGCSPMQWLRQRRLEAVRAELARPETVVTVADIARRHGFHHLSSFTATFRRTYGVLPSQVLRRGMRSTPD